MQHIFAIYMYISNVAAHNINYEKCGVRTTLVAAVEMYGVPHQLYTLIEIATTGSDTDQEVDQLYLTDGARGTSLTHTRCSSDGYQRYS